MESRIKRIELGSKAKDRITGIIGIVTCRADYLYGCIRYDLQPQDLKDGKAQEPYFIDEKQLEVLEPPTNYIINEETKREIAKKPTHGPRQNPVNRIDPIR